MADSQASRGTVIVIDDEKDLIELVRYNLEKEGFLVLGASDGKSGLELASTQQPDIVLLDLMLPDIDGLEVCRRMRQSPTLTGVPIVMLTAKAAEADRVVGLELGADDYITKPFSPRELVARVRAILRRASTPKDAGQVIRRGDLVIDSSRHEVTCKSVSVSLTATEFRILSFLAAHPGRVYSRSDIIDSALGRDVAVLDRTIDVHVLSIRKKLGACGDYIETLRGVGYKFRS
ncbi:MAG TPA: response regulator transcription factor [Planctomycetota bacterium]|jgi:DNA-binding response OmpR family regulator